MIEIITIFLAAGFVSFAIIVKIKQKMQKNFETKLVVETQKIKEVLAENLNKEIKKIEFQATIDAKRTAKDDLSVWKSEHERDIRKDAVTKSRSITLGKVSEQLIPFFPNFNYNPKDARFMGSPTDLVIFDGLDDGNLKKIVFVEIKTGKSKLNKREEQVKEVVINKQIEWATIELGEIVMGAEND